MSTYNLQLQGVIGFNGKTHNGLLLHPLDEHLLYPLGSSIVIKNLIEKTQTFLHEGGHDQDVSCMALSCTGKYLATGQKTHMGFPAKVIIWDLETYEMVHTLALHVGKIQDLSFSPDEKFLCTLGGVDDNKLVVWDVETGEAICGETASTETALTLKWFNNRSDFFVTGGTYNLRVWHFNAQKKKMTASDVELGNLRRIFQTILVDDDDQRMFVGTNTGDIIKVSLKTPGYYLFKTSGPKKPFQRGVNCLIKQTNGHLAVGAGDGTVAVLTENFKELRRKKFAGAVTSLALNAAQDHFFVGTDKCNIFLTAIADLEHEPRSTCHFAGVRDVAFPHGYSDLFATCSENDIRVWHTETRNELLRINVPGLTCNCVGFSPDGKSLISGWSDGKIRAFKPQSGKLLYAINDAHINGVTSIACSDNERIISGGVAGQVRVWRVIRHRSYHMVASMKEHKSSISSINISADGSECVTASLDGSCIVWDLVRFVRNLCLFASTQFQACLYHPDQAQLLTAGSDRKITYWDAVGGDPETSSSAGAQPIRITEGSEEKTINSLDISKNGDVFVSAASDKLVKIWGYDEGFNYCQGVGHSGEITKVKISPDQQTIVSVGTEGAIFVWTMPILQLGDDEGEGEQ